MALIALAVMDSHNKSSSDNDAISSQALSDEVGGRTLNEQVDWVTTAIAPVVASMHQFDAPFDAGGDELQGKTLTSEPELWWQ